MSVTTCFDFQVEDLFLDCDDPKKLVKCRWNPIGLKFYVVYRTLTALYLLITTCLVLSTNPKYYFIYLTNWGYLILTLNFIIKDYLVYKYYNWLTEDESGVTSHLLANTTTRIVIPSLLQVSWLLTNISSTVGAIITICFWALLYPLFPPQFEFGYSNIMVHAANTMFLVVDIFMISIPIRMSHIYQPLAFLLAYTSFTGIYWAAGGVTERGTRAIYPILTWDLSKWEITLSAFFAILAVLFITHGIFVGLSRLRDYCATKSESSQRTISVIPNDSFDEHNL